MQENNQRKNQQTTKKRKVRQGSYKEKKDTEEKQQFDFNLEEHLLIQNITTRLNINKRKQSEQRWKKPNGHNTKKV